MSLERTFYYAAVGMNPPRNDAWPAPRAWQHVWVRLDHTTIAPLPGLILDWRKTGSRWTAWVVWLDDSSSNRRRIHQGWLPAEQLRPARSDPNIWNEGRWR